MDDDIDLISQRTSRISMWEVINTEYKDLYVLRNNFENKEFRLSSVELRSLLDTISTHLYQSITSGEHRYKKSIPEN